MVQQHPVQDRRYYLFIGKLLVQERWRVLLTRLHAHERAPYEDSRAIQQACNHVTQDQDYIGPVSVDVGLHVAPHAVQRGVCIRLSAVGAISAEKRRFFVCKATRDGAGGGGAHGWGASCARGGPKK